MRLQITMMLCKFIVELDVDAKDKMDLESKTNDGVGCCDVEAVWPACMHKETSKVVSGETLPMFKSLGAIRRGCQ